MGREREVGLSFDINDYAPVDVRIAAFVADFPDGCIKTFCQANQPPFVLYEAQVFKTREDVSIGAYTSGWASEIEGSSKVNKTSHHENAETSAIGRALANMGYTTSTKRPSRQEMLKVRRQQEQHEALMGYIQKVHQLVRPEQTFELDGQGYPIQQWIHANYAVCHAQLHFCHKVVTALEAATGIPQEVTPTPIK